MIVKKIANLPILSLKCLHSLNSPLTNGLIWQEINDMNMTSLILLYTYTRFITAYSFILFVINLLTTMNWINVSYSWWWISILTQDGTQVQFAVYNQNFNSVTITFLITIGKDESRYHITGVWRMSRQDRTQVWPQDDWRTLNKRYTVV